MSSIPTIIIYDHQQIGFINLTPEMRLTDIAMSIYVFFYNQIPKYTMTCRFKFLSDLIISNTLIKSPEVEVTVPNDATIESFTHFTISDLHSLAEIEFPNMPHYLNRFSHLPEYEITIEDANTGLNRYLNKK